ncbi:hypothetical protein HW561_16565 [Rhodobacteraceae bacterium B1Z28]|uniref:GS catalytic domain-containing protein n=1 Tax=Ruegeria haliotis TaxID=2747601 RepID=A0ABX2PUQ0_9RHOB|nr:hypothetical protein [Ruegeria haliotis]NVO57410.1 hypothetical protein [Ruegeria haliotis]
MTLADWVEQNPQIENLILCAPDVNGIMRGKAVPAAQAVKLEEGSARMALSTATVDIWDDEIPDCSQVQETGDCDVVMRPTGRLPMPSVLNSHNAFVAMDFWMEDGSPMQTSCRHALIALLERFKARGWRPVVALEFEFYLYDGRDGRLSHPLSPRTGQQLKGRETAQVNDLEHFADWLADIRANCTAATTRPAGSSTASLVRTPTHIW